jgi:Rrf2 family protein
MNYPYFQVSKKSGYAIRALFELALRPHGVPANVRSLANSQDIPSRFLEIILNELKQGGFVLSVRGKSGGYLLARDSDEITIGQVIRFLERNNELDNNSLNATPVRGGFALSSVLKRINQAVSGISDAVTLQDMVKDEMKYQSAFTENYVI